MRTIVSLLLGIALTGTFSGAAHAQDAGATGDDTLRASRPDFRLLRQEENWADWTGNGRGLAALKRVPLGRDGAAVLTLGGETRAYGRLYRNEQWGAGPASDAYLLQRVMLHGAVQTALPSDGARLRAFAQLKSGTVSGRDGPIYPPDKDLLGVNQAFLEMQSRIGPQEALTMRVGRQELHYGAGRMIAVREGPNVRLGFDAALGRYRSGPWRVDAFAAKPNETPPDVFDNGWMTGRTLWGLYVTRREGEGGWSMYYFGTDRRPSPTANAFSATRHTVGGRVHGAIGAFAYDLEGAVQFGRYERSSTAASPERSRRGRIYASILAAQLSYRFYTVAGQPTLGVRGDWSSGNAGGTDAHETFAAPYPSGRFTGAGSRLGPGNLMKAVPFLTLPLRSGLRLHLKSYFFWRSSTEDGIYAIWGAPLRPVSGSSARYVGVMPEMMLTWTVDRHTTLALEASHFVAGPVLEENPPAHDLTHVGLRATYKF